MSGTSGQPSFEVAPSLTTVKRPNGALPRHVPSMPELMTRLAVTLGVLAIYRLGTHPPLAGIDQTALANLLAGRPGGVGKPRFGVYRRARHDFRAGCNAHHPRIAGRRDGPLGVGALQ